MIIDTTPDGIRIRRKSAAEQEQESRAAKRRKAGNRVVMNIPTGPDEEVQAALARAAAEKQQEITGAEPSGSNWASTSSNLLSGTNQDAIVDPDPELDIEWESRAAGVRDTITELLGGKAWLTQRIGDVGAIQIRGNGGLCAVKNAIKAAQKLPSVQAQPKNGRLPSIVCRLLLKEFKAVRRSVKGKSYNTWFMTNFAKGDFDRVTKALKDKGEGAIEDPIPAPFPQPREGSHEPTVRRLQPYYPQASGTGSVEGGSSQTHGEQSDYPEQQVIYQPQDEQVQNGSYNHHPQGAAEYPDAPHEYHQEGNHHQSYLTNGDHYQNHGEDYVEGEGGVGGGNPEEYQNIQEQGEGEEEEQQEFRPQDLAHSRHDSEADAVEALIQSHANSQRNGGERDHREADLEADAEGEEDL